MWAGIVQLLPSLGRGLLWLLGKIGLGLWVISSVKKNEEKAKLDETTEAGKDDNTISQLSDSALDDLLRHDTNPDIKGR